MPTYAAVLGHQPALSLSELAAVIPDFTPQRMLGEHVCVFASDMNLTDSWMRTIGGTVFLARQITEAGLDDVPQIMSNALSAVKGKVTFSIRGYNTDKAKLHKLYRSCKEYLKKNGRPSRYVGTERTPTPAVLLRDAGLLDLRHGCELMLLPQGKEFWIGRTVAAQDVNTYAKRDMGKPVRDLKTVLLPPKLAQILLNFAFSLAAPEGKNPKLTIVDPFCGTGVILLEAMMRGWNVLGSDLSERAVKGATKNIEWIRKEENILKKNVEALVWKQDARKPFDAKNIPAGSPAAIVTETSLGTTLEKKPTLRDATKMRNDNEKLQIDFLTNAKATLPGLPIVCIWPVWRTSKGPVYLEKIWAQLPKIGYTPVLPPRTKPHTSGHFSMIYQRPEQFVGREIVLLKPKK